MVDRIRGGGVRRAWAAAVVLLSSLVLLGTSDVAFGQEAPGTDGAGDVPAWAAGGVSEIPIEELRIRLVPVPLGELEAIRAAVIAEVRAAADDLADAMIEVGRLAAVSPASGLLSDEAAQDPEIEEHTALARRTIGLLLRKTSLMAASREVLDAIEAKGGDVAADRAYVAEVASLRPDLRSAFLGKELIEPESSELALKRVDELVSLVRAQPPSHERAIPWGVPVSEFELELQPLTTEQVLERLDAWELLLQREVRQRIRIDILLNDSDKLEESLRVRNEGARLFGVEVQDVPLDELKAALAERAETQQQVITAIVDRMRVAIELCKKRGVDAQGHIDYITSATGRKLNFTDLSVLRVQLMQWLNSSTGGRLIVRNALVFVALVVVFWLLSRVAGVLTRSAVRRIPRSSSLLGPVLAGILQKVVIVVGVVVAAGAVGVDTGPLLATIGAAGLVIGLALQGTLSNFASGILILLNRPFDVGDVVDAGGVFGKVSAMNLVSTTILTFDNQLMLVPNNQIWNAVITNATGKKTRRVDLTFGIAYNADIGKAVGVLEDVLSSHPKTLSDPAPVVRVHELADNSVNLIARPWVRTADYWDVYWDLMREVKERFDAAGIGIPFPQRDLHVPGTIEVKLADGGAERGAVETPRVRGASRAAEHVDEAGPVGGDED